MISGSKSGYVARHPNNEVVFNANLCTKTEGKIWYGDLDLTLDSDTIQTLADSMKQDIYVLREHDARFDNEAAPKFERAVKIFRSQQ
jgi:hypothetical protein